MSKGRFGAHGGQYIPETLMNAVLELEEAYNHYKNDPEFQKELTILLNEYAGRPSRLYYAEHMTKDLGGAKIYFKERGLKPYPVPTRSTTCSVRCFSRRRWERPVSSLRQAQASTV